MQALKRTPLYDLHKKYGAKMTEFAGWEMPLQYEGIIHEHNAVRNHAGIFDVSHMGEIEVKGRQAFEFLQYVTTNDLSRIEDGQAIYSIICYAQGGVVDDVVIYRFSRQYYCVVVNASNKDKDYKWLIKNAQDYDVSISDISDKICQIAVQGPKSEMILDRLCRQDVSQITFFKFKKDIDICGIKCMVSRSGYTGEDGFEIYVPSQHAQLLWEGIMEAGKDYKLKPCGLGCRDTLRFEAGLPLYGNEISSDITPLEAGLEMFVKFDKTDFIGKYALLRQKDKGIRRKIQGIQMIGRGIPRHGYKVFYSDKQIGFITTGYHSPTLNKNIALALIDTQYSQIGTKLLVQIRSKKVDAVVTNKRFYNKNYKK